MYIHKVSYFWQGFSDEVQFNQLQKVHMWTEIQDAQKEIQDDKNMYVSQAAIRLPVGANDIGDCYCSGKIIV